MGNRGLLLDRDGVVNTDHGYVGKIEQFTFLPGLFPFLRTVQDIGFRLAILTNQSGVARGYYTEYDYQSLTRWMLNELSTQGIIIDLELACFEHPEGLIESYRRESFWRKPNPGMVIEATQRLNLDVTRSVFLGDNLRDLEAAQKGNIATCLWLSKIENKPVNGIKIVHDYNEALDAIQSA